MSHIVFCKYLNKEAKGLDFQLIPGELGKRIFDNISQEAWEQWQQKQTMLINEKKLNLMNIEDRKLITDAMVGYLFEKKEIKIDGFNPLEKA